MTLFYYILIANRKLVNAIHVIIFMPTKTSVFFGKQWHSKLSTIKSKTYNKKWPKSQEIYF